MDPRRAIFDALHEADEALKDVRWHLDRARDLLSRLPQPDHDQTSPAPDAAPTQGAPGATPTTQETDR